MQREIWVTLCLEFKIRTGMEGFKRRSVPRSHWSVLPSRTREDGAGHGGPSHRIGRDALMIDPDPISTQAPQAAKSHNFRVGRPWLRILIRACFNCLLPVELYAHTRLFYCALQNLS